MAFFSGSSIGKNAGSLTTEGPFLNLADNGEVRPFEEIAIAQGDPIEMSEDLDELTLGGRQRSTVMQTSDLQSLYANGQPMSQKSKNLGKEPMPKVDTKEKLSDSLDQIWLEYGKLNGLVNKQKELIS